MITGCKPDGAPSANRSNLFPPSRFGSHHRFDAWTISPGSVRAHENDLDHLRFADRHGCLFEPVQSPSYVSVRQLRLSLRCEPRTFPLGPRRSAPFSRRNLSSSLASRFSGMWPKSTTATPGPVGRNPHSRRVLMHLSLSKASPQPASHIETRICGLVSTIPNRYSRRRIRPVCALIAFLPGTTLIGSAGHHPQLKPTTPCCIAIGFGSSVYRVLVTLNACDRPAMIWRQGITDLSAALPQEPLPLLLVQALRDHAKVHHIGITVKKSAFFENLEAPFSIQATSRGGCNE